MPNPRAGTTLIEALIYVFLLALFAVLVVNMLMLMTTSYAQFRGIRDTAHSANVAFERVVREIRQANSVVAGESTFGSHPGRLKLNTTTAAGATTTVELYVSGSTLMIKEGAAAAASSTSPRVTVSNLQFFQQNTPNSEAVRVELTLSRPAVGNVPARADKFYDTIVLRGSY